MKTRSNRNFGLFVFVLWSALLAQWYATAAPSAEYCDAYAKERANSASPGGGAVVGGARGSLAGAAIGGIANGRKGARRGAAWGALGGAIAGGARQSNNRAAAYDRAYYDCMRRDNARY